MAGSYNELFGRGSWPDDTDLRSHHLCGESVGAATLVDASSNNNNLAMRNANVSSTLAGPASRPDLATGVLFDQQDQYAFSGEAAYSPILNRPLTHVLWFNRTSAASGDFQYMVSLGTVSGSNNGEHATCNDLIQLKAQSRSGGTYQDSSGVAGTADTWHHGATYHQEGGAGLQAFLDGVGDTPNTASTAGSGFDQYAIGGKAALLALNLARHHAIADAAVFARLLSAAEITEHRLGPEPLNVTAPVINEATPQVGDTLTLDNPDTRWDSQGNGSLNYLYNWTRSDDDQGTGETTVGSAATYQTVAGDADKYIRCHVTAANNGGSDAAEITPTAFVQISAGVGELNADPDDLSVQTSLTEPTAAAEVQADPDNLSVVVALSSPTATASYSTEADNLTVQTKLTSPSAGAGVFALVDDLAVATSLSSPAATLDLMADPDNLSVAVALSTASANAGAHPDDLTVATTLSSPSGSIGLVSEAAGCEARLRRLPAHARVIEEHI